MCLEIYAAYSFEILPEYFKITVVWGMKPCSPGEELQLLLGTRCLHV